jgi:Hypervirulence associated proteins TUDOR domain
VANLRKGMPVSWKSHGGTAEGKVVRKLTEPTQIKGHKVMATKDNPEFLVETDEGKRAAHKAKALKKL